MHEILSLEILKGRYYLEGLGLGGKIRLKWILAK
jgi:hypothetical protein